MAGLHIAGVMANKDIFMARYPAVGMGLPVSRPNGKPWAYTLEENLDAATQHQVIRTLQQAIEDQVTRTMAGSGL